MRERMKEERGAIAVLAALTIVILLAAVAFVIDISRLYHERQVLQNAVDFGSLAGAQDLPVAGCARRRTIASADALRVATANAPQVTAANLTITYQCVVGDHDGDGAPGSRMTSRSSAVRRAAGARGGCRRAAAGWSTTATRSRATSATRSGSRPATRSRTTSRR